MLPVSKEKGTPSGGGQQLPGFSVKSESSSLMLSRLSAARTAPCLTSSAALAGPWGGRRPLRAQPGLRRLEKGGGELCPPGSYGQSQQPWADGQGS